MKRFTIKKINQYGSTHRDFHRSAIRIRPVLRDSDLLDSLDVKYKDRLD